MRTWRTSEVGPGSRLYAWLVVKLRWAVVLAWVAAIVAAAVWLPGTTPNADLGGFAPPNSRAIATETASAKAFGFPLLSRTVLVQHDAGGLSPEAQRRVVERSVAVAQRKAGDVGPIAGVAPVVNVKGAFPSSKEEETTALTYVFSKPGTKFGEELAAARAFAKQQMAQPDDHFVGVGGTVPAQLAQSKILYDRLLLLEAATLLVVIAIVAIKFRSVVAPLVALVTAAASYFVAVRVTNQVGGLVQGGVPEELKPLVLALVLGIVTDYAIFYLSSMRSGLEQDLDRLTAATNSAAQTGRIVVVAGLAVAAGSAAMLVAESSFFRAFGPVLALSVLTSVVVSATLLPALLAIFGRALFWPSWLVGKGTSRMARAAARVLTWRVVAFVMAAACVAGLVYVGTAVSRLQLGVSFAAGLPSDSEPHAAARAAAAGFAPGIIAPTELLLQGNDVGRDEDKLVRLAEELQRQPGVAGVLSPSAVPDEVAERALVTEDGKAARFLVVFDHDPLGATAIGDANRLSAAMPDLLERVGLPGVEHGLAGDTAVAGELVAATNSDLVRIAIAVLVVNLVLLMVFLRAIVAPIVLLACSVLALAASLGLLTLLFQDRMGNDGITFYVPFAASVLLLSLGSDYNIYGVGHVWSRANHTTLRKALAERIPETSGAITAAGLTLAASFGMLALVPLRQFRELAFVMGVGVLLDALVVRSVLVPALLSLMGRFSAWPRKLAGTVPQAEPAAVSRSEA
jgi:RND superfamily putative drug exporter